MGFWQRLATNALGFMILSYLFSPYFHVSSLWAAAFASFLMAALNVFVKPLLFILTLPITILTMGLFAFAINALVLQLVSGLMGSQFMISSFGMALLISFLLTAFQNFMSRILGREWR